MATQVQFRGGTTTEHASFNGAAREVTVDTTKQTVVVQDGTTNGGFPLLGEKNADNVKLHLGGNGTTDNGDLTLYHDATNSYIENTTGILYLKSATSGVNIEGELRVEDVEGTTLRLGNTAAAASDGDYLSGIDFHIKDNNDATGAVSAAIRSHADQNHTASAKGTALSFHTTDDDTTTLDERFRITHDGKCGIGTSIPDNLLHLYASSTTQTADTESLLVLEKNGDSGITILSGYTSNSRILFGDSGDNDIGQIDYDHNNNSLTFVTAASPAITITNSQKVGIGTVLPDKDLTIASARPTIKLIDSDVPSAAAFATIDASSHAGLLFDADPNDDRSGSDIRFNVDGVERLRIHNDGRVYFGDYADAATQAYIEASGDTPWPLTISASNSTSVDRAIVFRLRPGHKAAEFDTTGHLKFPNGHGIDFSEVETSNGTNSVLDDYEEGHWDLTGGSCNIDLHDSYDTGWYVKVGHVVTVGAYVQSDETSTDTTTSLQFTLPFATSAIPSGGDGAWIGACSLNSFALDASVTQSTIAAGDATSIAFIRLNGGHAVTWTALKKSQFVDGKLMQFTLTYKCQ